MTKCYQCGHETHVKRARKLPEGYLCRKCFPTIKQRLWAKFCHNCDQYSETTKALAVWSKDINDYFEFGFYACEPCRINKQGWLKEKKWRFLDLSKQKNLGGKENG